MCKQKERLENAPKSKWLLHTKQSAFYQGILSRLLSRLMKDIYTCQVVHEGKLTDPIPVRLGVKQRCVLSPTIFLMVMDGVMRKAIGGKRRGINWSITVQLEDLNFVDDICLLSHTFSKMETKLQDLENEGKTVGLKIN
jgi:hypothetical protein